MTYRGIAALVAAAALSAVTLLAGCAPTEQAARARTSPAATAGPGTPDRVSPTRSATPRPRPEAAGTLPTRALSTLPAEAA
ncbi:hypothetical protein AB0P04_44650, partial [Streptomyces anulatus]